MLSRTENCPVLKWMTFGLALIGSVITQSVVKAAGSARARTGKPKLLGDGDDDGHHDDDAHGLAGEDDVRVHVDGDDDDVDHPEIRPRADVQVPKRLPTAQRAAPELSRASPPA